MHLCASGLIHIKFVFVWPGMPDETFIITSSFVYVPGEAREREGHASLTAS
jgi:hypothetical protein